MDLCLALRVECLDLDLDLLFEYLDLCLALRVECLDLDLDLLFEYLDVCLALRVECLDLDLDLDLLFEYLDLCLALRVECLDLGLKCLLTTLIQAVENMMDRNKWTKECSFILPTIEFTTDKRKNRRSRIELTMLAEVIDTLVHHGRNNFTTIVFLDTINNQCIIKYK